MAEDSDLEKTEQASSKKLEKAREQGDVPRSRELASFSVLMAASAGFWLSGPTIINQLKQLLQSSLSFNQSDSASLDGFGQHIFQSLLELFFSFLPMVVLLLLAILLPPMAIGGWVFSDQVFLGNFSRLNPLKGLANMLSSNTFIELGKAIAKSLLVGGVAWLITFNQFDDMFALIDQSLITANSHQGQILLTCFTAMVAALALIALIDVPYQIYHHGKKLMMTRQELRDEAKESEGNPEIKAKLRAQQREMARRRMMAQVPNADVIITNPTHYAVALQYAQDGNQAPIVLAKGTDQIAARMREIAMEHKIVLMEAPPLARALYQHTELGDEIPAALYTAVAQVLSYVFQLRAWEQGSGIAPYFPEQILVPSDMDPLNTETVQ